MKYSNVILPRPVNKLLLSSLSLVFSSEMACEVSEEVRSNYTSNP